MLIYICTLTLNWKIVKNERINTASCEYWVVAGGAGVNTGLDIVTKVCCSGSNFAIYRKRFQFHNGSLTSVGPSGVDDQPSWCGDEEGDGG